MAEPQILNPAPGCRIVTDGTETILFAQPPEVLKGLLRENIKRFETLVLTDMREKSGALLNNLEFPLYFFLFFARGLAEKRKLNLVGHRDSHQPGHAPVAIHAARPNRRRTRPSGIPTRTR